MKYLSLILLTILVFTGCVTTGTGTIDSKFRKADLYRLEKGQSLQGDYVYFENIWGDGYELIFNYDSEADPGGDNESTEVYEVLYPVISDNHPFWIKEAAFWEMYGDQEWKDVQGFYPVYDFVVLIKSTRYKTIGQLPDSDFFHIPYIKGVVTGKGTDLDGDSKSLIRDTFRDIDFSKIIIIEEIY